MKKEKKLKLQEIKLQCGIKVMVDWNSKDKCKKCGKDILWAMTKNKKFMPIVLTGFMEWDTHYADCPFADQFRKSKPPKNKGH